ncbi:uncharacterized protein PHACADRAFT_260795 [Phanerochaete carnosa HHB-10118-sp]|uniref:Uncharacterized protein n=1 Tax=Phanerochaete carnosa (strain HHB-10118-sp) TaxID=650164 RepID=K5WQ06_PHACS|nr:uncharacterized protein PHACADRAFT_260795 [Phanerochaete carnosa HHB-10118-sp]EKM52422.1 hypothetical protein PHACADRAFT_260795 [Phanerochaete carnosa HHB-10118-sp]
MLPPVYIPCSKDRTLLAVLSVLFVAELSGLSCIYATVIFNFSLDDKYFMTSASLFFIAYW